MLKVSDDGPLETRSFPLTDIRILLNSNRRYQNACFGFLSNKNNNAPKMLLEKFSLSLVDLVYYTGGPEKANSVTSELRFPKLEKLFISTKSEQQSVEVLQGATVVKELHLNESSMLKLMSVSSSLKTLTISECSKEECEYILTSFPNLNKFRVGQFSFIEISKFNNQSITEFSFGFGEVLPNNVISAMKNLEFIDCWICTEPKLRKILTEGKSLKRVKINKWFEDRDNPTPNDIYETLMASDPTILRSVVVVVTDD
jgi:hypothetical protein